MALMTVLQQTFGETEQCAKQIFMDAVTKCDEKLVEAFLSDGSTRLNTLSYDPSPLFIAASKENLPVLKLLLDAHFDVNCTDKSVNNGSLLHLAVVLDDKQQLVLLLEYSVDVNTEDDFGRTPLILSLQKQKFELSLELLRAGSDVEKIDTDGKSAYFYAKMYDAPDSIMKMLPVIEYDSTAYEEAFQAQNAKTSASLTYNAAAGTKPMKTYGKKKVGKAAK